jgi:hypothetical protein
VKSIHWFHFNCNSETVSLNYNCVNKSPSHYPACVVNLWMDQHHWATPDHLTLNITWKEPYTYLSYTTSNPNVEEDQFPKSLQDCSTSQTLSLNFHTTLAEVTEIHIRNQSQSNILSTQPIIKSPQIIPYQKQWQHNTSINSVFLNSLHWHQTRRQNGIHTIGIFHTQPSRHVCDKLQHRSYELDSMQYRHRSLITK